MNDGQLVRSILRLAAAEAKYDLRDEVTEADCENASWLLRFAYSTVEFDEEATGEFDAEVVDTGEGEEVTDTERVLALISSIEDEYDEGAPIERVIRYADSHLLLNRDETEKAIESLRKKGELYEPVQEHLRTTRDVDESIIEVGKLQREQIKSLKSIVGDLEEDTFDGAAIEDVLDRCEKYGMDREKAEREIESLRKKAEIYEPVEGHFRTT